MKRKFLSMVLAVSCSISMCLSGGMTANAVESVPGYDNVDNYMANSIIDGYVSLESGESTDAAGLYKPNNDILYTYESMAETIMEQDGLTSSEELFELDAEILGDVTPQQAYEIMLVDYLTFENDDLHYFTYDYTDVDLKLRKFALAILTDLVESGAADSEEEAALMIEGSNSANNAKMLDALKKLGYEKQLSAYTSILSEISSASNDVFSYYTYIALGLAISELNQDNVDFLNAMKKASPNADFCKAADKVIAAFEGLYSKVSLEDEYGYLYAIENVWDVIKKDLPVGIKAEPKAAYALDSLFTGSNEAPGKMRTLMCYNAGMYLEQALFDMYSDYGPSSNQDKAEDFHSAYKNHLIYQQYASLQALKYAESALTEDDNYNSITSGIKRNVLNSSTQITIIDSWYENYLEYTDTKTIEIDFSTDVVEYNGHYYKVFNNSISWIYAKEYCELMGGHLATVADEEEQYVVENVAKQSPEFDNFWIGGYKDKKTGAWKWVDGTPFEHKNWDINQPDNHRNEEFYIRFTNKDVIYENWTANEGKWNDCANEASGDDNTGDEVGIMTFAFICEWDSEESLLQQVPGDANNDGSVNVRDCAFIASKLAKGEGDTLTLAADFNGDGSINVRDAAAIAAALAKGLI